MKVKKRMSRVISYLMVATLLFTNMLYSSVNQREGKREKQNLLYIAWKMILP